MSYDYTKTDAENLARLARENTAAQVIAATTPKVKFDPNNITTIGQGSKRSGEKGRGDYSLVPKEVVDAYAKHLQEGVERGYPRNNWTLGQPLSRLHSSLLRHAFQLLNGELDEPHDRAVLFNIGAIIYMRAKIKANELPESLEDVFTDEQFRAFYGRRRMKTPNLKQMQNVGVTTIPAGALVKVESGQSMVDRLHKTGDEFNRLAHPDPKEPDQMTSEIWNRDHGD